MANTNSSTAKDLIPYVTPQSEQERLDTLAKYNPHDHLLTWLAYDKNLNQKVPVLYYPAAWRLYELNLRYPHANFECEIVHMDVEKDFVIIKARLYFGTDYAISPKRSSAYKQGKLSELDRVETKAKARAARDFGIGTEHALDFDEAESGMFSENQSSPKPANNRAQQRGRTVVEAVHEGDPRQKPQPALKQDSGDADKPPTIMELYNQGKDGGLWESSDIFYPFASNVIDRPVTKATARSITHIERLKIKDEIDAEIIKLDQAVA